MNLYVPPCPIVIISADKTEICTGETITIYAATYFSNYVYYQWYLNNSPIVGETDYRYTSNSIANKDVVYCMITGSTCRDRKSNEIEFNVHQKGPTSISISWENISISYESNYICSGETLLFSTTVISGGTSPTYQWYTKRSGNWEAIEHETNPTLRWTPIAPSEQIAVEMTSNAYCVSPSGATTGCTVYVQNKVPVSVSISLEPAGVICSGTSVTCTAIATNSGSTQTYQWYVNYFSGNTEQWQRSAFTYTPSHGDLVGVVFENTSDRCVTHNPCWDAIALSVIEKESPDIDIDSFPPSVNGTVAVPTGFTILFAVTNVEGVCGEETYQWYLEGSPVGTNSKYYSLLSTGHDRERVDCKVTSDCDCLNHPDKLSNSIDIEILSGNTTVGKNISIYGNKNIICSGETVCFSGATSGFTESATYTWKDDGTALFDSIDSKYFCTSGLTTGTHSITCTASEGTSVTSNAIPVTVTARCIPAVTISKTPAGQVCSGQWIDFIVSSTYCLGSSPTFLWQWRTDGGSSWQNIGTYDTELMYSTNELEDNNQVRVIAKSSKTCVLPDQYATGNTITVDISTSVTPSVSIVADTNCITLNEEITYTATPTNGGTSPTYDWYIVPDVDPTQSGTNNIFNHTFTDYGNKTVLCIMTPNLTCVSPSTASDSLFLPTCTGSTMIDVGELYIEIAEEYNSDVNEMCCVTPEIGGSNITISSSNPGSLTALPFIKQNATTKRIDISKLQTGDNLMGNHTSYMFFMTGQDNIFSISSAARIKVWHNGNCIYNKYTIGSVGSGYMNWYETLYIDVYETGEWYVTDVSNLFPAGKPQFQSQVGGYPRIQKEHNYAINVNEYIILFDVTVGNHSWHWVFPHQADVEGEGLVWETYIQNPRVRFPSTGQKVSELWVNGIKSSVWITVV